MSLLTDDLDQARRAYEALEARARSAEERAEKLQADRAKLLAQQPIDLNVTALLRQRVLDLEGENFRLATQVEQLARLKSDLPLNGFIDSVGLAAALGEASMPDRAIASIKAEVRTYLAPSDTGVGLRFQQPELGALSAGLSTTTFEIVKLPPVSGAPARANLYSVLQEKQRVYENPFWSRFGMAAQISAEITKVLSENDTWSFAYVAQAATNIAALENRLGSSASEFLRSESLTAYLAAINALADLANMLTAKANPVVGDLLALTSALDLTTGDARSLIT